jgi:hypothetical protein
LWFAGGLKSTGIAPHPCLDHNETRSWHGWHRHVSLVMLAFAMMTTIRHHANATPVKKTLPRLPKTTRSSSAGQSRKSVAS